MVWVLGGTAVLCLLYYIIIVYLFRCFDFVCLDLALLGDRFGTSGGWMVVWQPAWFHSVWIGVFRRDEYVRRDF